MRKLKDYSIGFKGLKDGNHLFDYSVNGDFFALFEDALYQDGTIQVQINLNKGQQMLILDYHIEGYVASFCDNCLESINVPVKYNSRQYVKFGDVFEEPDDDIIVIPREEHEINVAHTTYDLIVTSLPIRHLHPKDKKGNSGCDPEMVKKLSEYMVDREPEQKQEHEQDPRWDALKKLIDKNK